jgi:cytoskeleton protein RodZ
MNDTYEQGVAEQGVAEMSTSVSMGVVLKSVREARQLDIEDVCSYLRLSRRQVIALENDDFSSLPEATITRGFIRNYARMLELDAEPLLDAYRNLSGSEELRPISISSENIRLPGNDKAPWLLYVMASILIVILVTAWVVYVDYIPKTDPEAVYVPSETELEAAGSIETTLPPVAELLSSTSAPPANGEETPDQSAVVVTDVNAIEAANASATDATASEVVAAGMAVVKLQASERSWVSITDRNNKTIFDKIMVAGIEEAVQGEPPLQVVIGNAPHTTLIYNNQTVDLAPVTHDRVARLKLE